MLSGKVMYLELTVKGGSESVLDSEQLGATVRVDASPGHWCIHLRVKLGVLLDDVASLKFALNMATLFSELAEGWREGPP